MYQVCNRYKRHVPVAHLVQVASYSWPSYTSGATRPVRRNKKQLVPSVQQVQVASYSFAHPSSPKKSDFHARLGRRHPRPRLQAAPDARARGHIGPTHRSPAPLRRRPRPCRASAFAHTPGRERLSPPPQPLNIDVSVLSPTHYYSPAVRTFVKNAILLILEFPKSRPH